MTKPWDHGGVSFLSSRVGTDGVKSTVGPSERRMELSLFCHSSLHEVPTSHSSQLV